MKRKKYYMAFAVVVAVAALTAIVLATPLVDSVVLTLNVWEDCIFHTVTTTNNYPAQVEICDDWTQWPCGSWANLHIWALSEDGGASEAVFNNDASFRFSATLVISGTGEGESGLRISPWWSQQVDGRFNIRTTDGEIACFGGRLPFYSFTGTYEINYVKGDPIWLEMVYCPNSLTEEDPATIVYNLEYPIGTPYTSGPIPFDEGNPSEPYGTWGFLDDARAGGYVQPLIQLSGDVGYLCANWTDHGYEVQPATGTESSSWGDVKTQFR